MVFGIFLFRTYDARPDHLKSRPWCISFSAAQASEEGAIERTVVRTAEGASR